MKRLLKLNVVLILAGFSLLVSSCTEDHYYDKGGENEPSAYWSKYTIDVSQNQWLWDGEREQFYYIIEPAWLSEYIAWNGIVDAYIDKGNVYQPLPYTTHKYFPANNYYYTETINYEFDAEYLCFVVEASDLFRLDPNYIPPSYRFEVRLVW